MVYPPTVALVTSIDLTELKKKQNCHIGQLHWMCITDCTYNIDKAYLL
jgi:hypothetical protein